MSFEILQQGVEVFPRDGFVVVPPDGLLRRLVADRELVLCRTARVGAGLDNERAGRSEMRFAAANGFLDQLYKRPIVTDGLGNTQRKRFIAHSDIAARRRIAVLKTRIAAGCLHGRRVAAE